jgi:hypothetical protein
LSGSVRAAEEVDPFTTFGLRLVDDLKLKWRDSIPEFAPFEEGEALGWQPWGRVRGEASFSGRSGRTRVGFGVGRLGLRLDSHTLVEGSAARVRLRLGLDVGTGKLTLRLPDVKMTPRFDKGQLGFDWIVPIIEERF